MQIESESTNYADRVRWQHVGLPNRKVWVRIPGSAPIMEGYAGRAGSRLLNELCPLGHVIRVHNLPPNCTDCGENGL